MSKIVIGQSGRRNVSIDIPALLRSRLLVEANSGGGKSFLLRRIAEQAFGKVQTILIDPEGEFASLREKYAYVLAGEGGETPADVRAAGLLAQRLLELRVSAVCDLYEAFRKSPSQRRAWVAAFLEALIDAPKSLWHPLLVIVDESHKFCPQEMPRAGSSQERADIMRCKEAMISLATTGRKRAFCAIWATQRLAKLDKDASAELLNRLVGLTFEDVDIDRAVDLLSVSKEEKHEFRRGLRVLEPGNFYAIGRAITTERLLVQVGSVETTHPEIGGKLSMAPPPTPDKIKALLPQLADLPQEAEARERTVAEMKREIADLRRQLRKTATPTVGKIQKQTVVDQSAIARAVRAAQLSAQKLMGDLRRELREAMKVIVKINAVGFDAVGVTKEDVTKAMASAADQVAKLAERKIIARGAELSELKKQAARVSSRLGRLLNQKDDELSVEVEVRKREPFTVTAPHKPAHIAVQGNGDGSVTGPEQRILNAIAWMNSIGVHEPEQTAVAFLAGYTFGGGGFNNPRGALNTKGMVSYLSGNRIALTDAGRALAQCPDTPLDSEELQKMVLERLPGPESKILRVLLEHRDGLSNEELAGKAGYTFGSGGYNNPRGRLRTLGLVEYSEGKVVPKALLWLEQE